MSNICRISNQWLPQPAQILETRSDELGVFNQLVLDYQDTLFNTAQWILNDDELAADATQNAFISAFRNINSFRGSSFKAWLIRIVTNTCYDELRRQKRRPTVPLKAGDGDDNEMDEYYWMAEPGPSPEETMETAELEQAIHTCLAALPVDSRTVIVLIDIQGLTYIEAARVVCVPLGTIKSRLARARLSMRARIQEFTEF
jgi:RNA polymerase sigma-70 factor (ECF subfamily)